MSSSEEIPLCITETNAYLDHLNSFDYSLQDVKVQNIYATNPNLFKFPISHRFAIRPMTPDDIPACAHLLMHSFSAKGLFYHAIGLQSHKRVHEWIAKMRVCLCDHISFVIEDTEIEETRYKNLYDESLGWCDCQKYTPFNFTENNASGTRLGNPCKIVAMVMAHDLVSRINSLTVVSPSHMAGSIKCFMGEIDKRRISRIREDNNLLLSQEEIKEREEREAKEKAEGKIHPQRLHHYERKREKEGKENMKTKPESGEGLFVWYLATRPSHEGFKLGSFISLFLYEYIKRETDYKFITVEAAHPATERIWRGEKIGGKLMSRMKTREFEYKDEKGEIVRPFASVDYDMCCMDVDIKS